MVHRARRKDLQMTFSHHYSQTWYVKAVASELWAKGCAVAKYDLLVKPIVSEVVKWVNEFISRIIQA